MTSLRYVHSGFRPRPHFERMSARHLLPADLYDRLEDADVSRRRMAPLERTKVTVSRKLRRLRAVVLISGLGTSCGYEYGLRCVCELNPLACERSEKLEMNTTAKSGVMMPPRVLDGTADSRSLSGSQSGTRS